ncbi:carbohydrate-responsive element-binding protein-like, partial [Microcaecilia unicolor]|uniref:Carbohydrate-responsive element-binding protein-like n=1 Tax=Microcaecilia unicolor TaxID=1415580 RepID=A0A6P7X384_9AMPH
LRKTSKGDDILEQGDVWQSAEKWCSQLFCAGVPMMEENEEEDRMQLFDLDCFLSDISDTLFTMTQGMCAPPTVSDCDYAGNADMIQPDLTQLQPNLDDFMDIPELSLTKHCLWSDQQNYSKVIRFLLDILIIQILNIGVGFSSLLQSY